MRGDTIADAMITNASGFPKNAADRSCSRNAPDEKGNEERFGMRAYRGVDAGIGAVVTLKATAANVHDVVVATSCSGKTIGSLWGLGKHRY